MRTVVVKREIKAPIEQVFEALSDHGAYVRFSGIRKAVLLRPGRSEKNGVGAVRRIEVESGLIWFEEEITAFERPGRMDYKIQRSQPALRHQGGSIRLHSTAGGTQVLWTSTFEMTPPLGQDLLTCFFGLPTGWLGFHFILRQIDRRLAR